MQTFVPYGADFERNAQVLDRQRLGKQRVEAFQIVKALTEESYGWKNHPAVKMWRDHIGALGLYGIAICREWINRGYKDTMLPRFEPVCNEYTTDTPSWLDDNELMISHRSNLLRKDPGFYGQYWPELPHDIPYVWPVK